MLSEKEIKNNYQWLSGFAQIIKEKSDFCYIGSDQTRIKILLLLKRHKELCVTDLAKILRISLSAISHQLSLFEKSNLLIRTRMGQIVCYSLNKKNQEIMDLLNFKGRLTR